MKVERLTSQCISCLLNKHLNTFPTNFSAAQKTKYMQGVLKIIGNADMSMSAPEILELINEHRQKMGIVMDFSDIKTYFNELLLSIEENIDVKIENSANPLKTAIQYAMAGNFIDFGSMKTVDEEKLKETLDNAETITIDKKVLEIRIIAGFYEKLNIYDFSSSQRKFPPKNSNCLWLLNINLEMYPSG